MPPEIFRLVVRQPNGIDQSQIPDVRFLSGDQFGKDHELRFTGKHR